MPLRYTTRAAPGHADRFPPSLRTPSWSGGLLIWSPVILLAAWSLLMLVPGPRTLLLDGFRTNREYTFVEIGTGLAFLGAAGFGAATAIGLLRRDGALWRGVYFALFALAAVLVVLEETQWGQPILGYEIPGWMMENNRQGEFTLHNIGVAQGREDLFFLAFCLPAALLHLARFPGVPERLWRDLRAPAALKPMLLAIALVMVAKAVAVQVTLPETPREILRWTTEIAEFYIALWALLYAASKARRPD